MKYSLRRLAAFTLACLLPATAAAETVTLPESVTVIEREAFAGDTSIGKVIVPEGTIEIQSRAFADSSLTEIVLPETLTEIADDMFDGCGKVTITAPEGSKAYVWAAANGYIGAETPLPESQHPYAPNSELEWHYSHPTDAIALAITFSEDTELEEDYDYLTLVDAENNTSVYHGTMLAGKTVYAFGNAFSLYLSSDYSGEYYGFRVTKIEAITSAEQMRAEINTRVLDNGTLAVTGCTGIAIDLEIPAEIDGVPVTQIDGSAFQRMPISSVSLPDGLVSIGDLAFSECTRLKSIDIPDSVEEIGGYCFDGCTALESVVLPDNLREICDATFRNCSALGNVVIPQRVEVIYSNAFWNCESMTQVHIPANVSLIDYKAFGCEFYCTSRLNSITVAEENKSFESIDGMLVDKNYRRLVAYPGGKTDAEITVPDGVEIIGCYAFSASDNLKKVTVPGSVKILESSAFEHCDSLETVVLQEGVAKIYDSAFGECQNLTSITIPASVTEIGLQLFPDAYDPETDADQYFVKVTAPSGSFAENWCLENAIPLASGMETVVSGDFTFTKFNNTLILNRYYHAEEEEGDAITELAIPASVDGVPVTMISTGALEYLSLQSITIPEGVTVIGNYAFNGCMELSEISLPNSVKKIGNYAFDNNISLEQITLPENLETLGWGAFMNCSGLTQMVIPDKVHTINESAFLYCENLQRIFLPDSLTHIGAWAFDYCHPDFTIYGNAGSFAEQYAGQNNIPFVAGNIPE